MLIKDLDLPGLCLYQSLQRSYPTQDLSGSPRRIDSAPVSRVDSEMVGALKHPFAIVYHRSDSPPPVPYSESRMASKRRIVAFCNQFSQRGSAHPLFVSFTTLMATLAGPILQIIYLICLVASNNNLTITFHAIYGIATVLPVIIIVLRMFMVDSALFHNSHFTQQRRPFRLYVLLARRYWWRIFTTSLAFFLYDFINFPNSIMSSTIIASLVKDNDIRKTAVWQVVLAVLPVPGVMIGAWLTNAIGRRNTGILGFAGYVVLGFVIGGTGEQAASKDSYNIRWSRRYRFKWLMS